jgi:uncharacterized protein
MHIDDSKIIADTTLWLERVVIGLNLCPFAKAVHIKNQIRTSVLRADDTDTIADALCDALDHLAQTDAEITDTTLIVVLGALDDFDAFNDFLGVADAIIDGMGYTGTFQLASFHPHYQFEGTQADDVTNFTNRSPYPMLHILRESSVDRAVAAFPDAEDIFEKNMETMEALGIDGVKKLMTNS